MAWTRRVRQCGPVDAEAARARLNELWIIHGRLAFPESVDKSDDLWEEIHPVAVDMDVAGVVSHVVGKSRLGDDQLASLLVSLRELDYVIAHVPAPARDYFLRLREMGQLALIARLP